MKNKEKQKEFIYFPSLSAGGCESALIKDENSGKISKEQSNELRKLKLKELENVLLDETLNSDRYKHLYQVPDAHELE